MLSGTFGRDAEAALAWCLREAVTNVVRHSAARTCCISLARRAGTMTLTVRDDGTGLTGPGAPGEHSAPGEHGAHGEHSTERVHGSGLHGMSERLSAVGGTLQLRPDLRPGFCLIASVPATAQPAPDAPDAPEVTSSTV
jgi:two-component system sensor histidine kinase DesK